MSRRHSAEKREINPDAKFGNLVISKFMNSIMYEGKKSVAETIVLSLRSRAAEMIQRIARAWRRSVRTSTGTW